MRKDAALLGLVNCSRSCTGKPEALPIPKKYIFDQNRAKTIGGHPQYSNELRVRMELLNICPDNFLDVQESNN